MSRTITGWKLPADERERLLGQFAPHYELVVADHVTLRFGTDADTPLPGQSEAEVVGEVDDGKGVHALVIAVDSRTMRGDGGHFHITWSLGPDRKAKESNDAIAALGWEPVAPPVAIRIEPARWKP